MKNIKLNPLSLLVGSAATAGLFLLSSMQGTLTTERIFTLTPEQAEILSHQSIVYLDDGQGGRVKTLRISRIKVQIVNGTGATNGYPADPDSIDPLDTQTNGVGNLIVGYNELGNVWFGDDRTGSHNLVVGHGNSYTSFGGRVGPLNNAVSGPFASVVGGQINTASGPLSSVSGGFNNKATGFSSSVSGGRNNTASGQRSSVSGGYFNTASGLDSSVSGGGLNRASWVRSSVSGGRGNLASGIDSSVSGGAFGTASGYKSSVSGGSNRTAPGDRNWVAGDLFQDH